MVTIDASLAKLGRRTFQIGDDDVHRPRGLHVADVDPDEVKVSLEKMVGGTADAAR